MAKLKGQRLAAGTLVEVLVAMVIIMVIFGIAMRIFGNVMQSGASYKKTQIAQQMDLLAKEVVAVGRIPEYTFSVDSVEYQLTERETERNGIFMLEIKALQNGKTVGNYKTLFETDEKP